jgi:hypothetical protein
MPMSLVTRLLKSGKTELYITFMYEFIDRFKKPRWTLQNRPFVDGSKPAISGSRDR